MIDHLVKSINSNASEEAEHTAQKLAKLRADVQFSLISRNDNQEENVAKSKSNSDDIGSSDSVLRLVDNIYFYFSCI
jgi:hypothetical protein